MGPKTFTADFWALFPTLGIMLLSIAPLAPAQQMSLQPGLVQPSDVDGDGIANAEDANPLVSNYPIVLFEFSPPVIGVRFNLSGNITSTETRSLTTVRTSNLSRTQTESLTSKESLTSTYADKMTFSLNLGANPQGGKGLSVLPAFGLGVDSSNTDVDFNEWSSLQTTLEHQSVTRERREFNETVQSNKISFESDGGYLDSNLYSTNFSADPISVDNVTFAVRYIDERGRERAFANGVRLQLSTIVGTTGPAQVGNESKLSGEPLTIRLPAARRRVETDSRAVVLSNLNVGAVMDLANKAGVSLVLEDYQLLIGSKPIQRLDYEPIIELLSKELLTLRVIGPSQDSLAMISSKTTDGKLRSLQTILTETLGEAIDLVQLGEYVYAKTIDHAKTDTSWSTDEELIKADSHAGRWAIFVDSEPATPASIQNVGPGSDVSLVFVSNSEIQQRLFRTIRYTGHLTLSTRNFTATLDPEGTKSKSTEQKRSSGPFRVCTSEVVQPGDAVSLFMKTELSRDETIQTFVKGEFPGGNNSVDLKVCEAQEYFPSNEFYTVGPNEPLSSHALQVSFGKTGATLPLEALVARLPEHQVEQFGDGQLALRFRIDRRTVSKASPICFGVSDLKGVGTLGRSVKSNFSCGSGALAEGLCKLFRQNCDRWKRTKPEKLEQSFNREVKTSVTVVLHQSAVREDK